MLTEFNIEEAASCWFSELGYQSVHGPDIILVDRLRAALACLSAVLDIPAAI